MTDLPTVLVLPIMYFAVKPGPQSISKQPAFLSPPGFKATNMHREILIALVQMQRSNYNFAERKCWGSRFQHTAQSNIRNGNAIVPAYRAGHQVLPADDLRPACSQQNNSQYSLNGREAKFEK
jgi:hypothetical protein